MPNRNDTLEAFYKANYNTFCKRLARRAGSPENAEDVVQEAFSLALKYWGSYDSDKNELGSWFNTILNNALKKFKKTEMSFGMCVELDEEQLEGIEMSQTDGPMRGRIQEYIEDNEGKYKEVLDLYFNKGYMPREIAEITDVDNKAIRAYICAFKIDVKEKLIDRDSI